MTRIHGNVLSGHRRIDIFAVVGGGVSLDLPVGSVWVIQHPSFTRVDRRDDIHEFDRRPRDVAVCHNNRIHRQSQVIPEHGLGFEDNHDVVLPPEPTRSHVLLVERRKGGEVNVSTIINATDPPGDKTDREDARSARTVL